MKSHLIKRGTAAVGRSIERLTHLSLSLRGRHRGAQERELEPRFDMGDVDAGGGRAEPRFEMLREADGPPATKDAALAASDSPHAQAQLDVVASLTRCLAMVRTATASLSVANAAPARTALATAERPAWPAFGMLRTVPHGADANAPSAPLAADRWRLMPGNTIELEATGFVIQLNESPSEPTYVLRDPEGRRLVIGYRLDPLKDLATEMAREREIFMATGGEERAEAQGFLQLLMRKGSAG